MNEPIERIDVYDGATGTRSSFDTASAALAHMDAHNLTLARLLFPLQCDAAASAGVGFARTPRPYDAYRRSDALFPGYHANRADVVRLALAEG